MSAPITTVATHPSTLHRLTAGPGEGAQVLPFESWKPGVVVSGAGEGLRGTLLRSLLSPAWLTSQDNTSLVYLLGVSHPPILARAVYNHIQGTKREEICPFYPPLPPKTSQTSWRLDLVFLSCG